MKVLYILLLFVCLGEGSCNGPPYASVPFVSGGYRANVQFAPWHAGLYKKTTKPYRQICGATIIAKRVVLTAAHCFTMDRTLPPACDFAVGAGKIYRPWNDPNDTGAQKRDVVQIHIPPRYQGSIANFQQDIALAVLNNEFLYDGYVEPACVNFDPKMDETQLREGELGTVVGWGLTGANDDSSQVLQAATLPSVSIDRCIEQSPPSFRSSITGDKICAGYSNGTAVCRGDSGGGLVFSAVVKGYLHDYLRGVVSTSPSTQDQCNVHTWATFTHVLSHEHFIKSIVPDVDSACKPSNVEEFEPSI